MQVRQLLRGGVAPAERSLVVGEVSARFLAIIKSACHFLFEFRSLVQNFRVLLKLIRHLTVLAETVDEVVAHALTCDCLLGEGGSLLHHLFLLLDLAEPGVLQSLRSCNTVIRIVNQQLHNQIFHFFRCVGQ